jgi:hypothetical protein
VTGWSIYTVELNTSQAITRERRFILSHRRDREDSPFYYVPLSDSRPLTQSVWGVAEPFRPENERGTHSPRKLPSSTGYSCALGVPTSKTTIPPMSNTHHTTEEFEIVIAPSTVVAALRDRYEHGHRREGEKVITVWPPFEGRSHAEHRFRRAESQWPPEMDVIPLDLSPDVFIDESAAIAGAEETDRDREWDDDRASEIRAALRDEIDITEYEKRPTDQVTVRYETQ